MSDMPTHFAYTKRFNAVLAYRDANLEGDLSVRALSQVANFSTFHFHRQFSAFVGVPVSRYVQLTVEILHGHRRVATHLLLARRLQHPERTHAGIAQSSSRLDTPAPQVDCK